MSNAVGINPECLQYSKQDFQVSVAVYKARHLQVFNADTFVLVSLDGKYKRTKMAYRTDCPYFNDYFSFELRTTKQELLKKSVLFQLYRAATCTMMGSCVGRFSIDLRTIWDQINHGFIRKWASFDPAENTSTSGFHHGVLMLDVFIVPSFETPSPVIFHNTVFDVIESNLLLPYANCSTARRVQYSCSIRSGHFTRAAKYAIQISYSGQKVCLKLA
ncbi:otoferlin-like [Anopheles bellator]|uniref:otoferlin-like n=1 Tax=Anopheles bellator TaxID=139047 RepID=UPI002647BFD9|nr:otoferlin-like [Anopheles bellator]